MSDYTKTNLFRKIYGYVAAGSVGNSMGEVPECYTVEERQKYWGYIDYLPEAPKYMGPRLPSVNDDVCYIFDPGLGPPRIGHPHVRPPGTTEDGEERFRLLSTAIIEKGGRINIIDLAKVWMRDLNPDMFGWLVPSQDQVIYYSLKAGVHPWEVGRYATWPGLYGTTKMIGAVGVVNACFPEQAAMDAMELARIKDVRGIPGNYAIEVAGAHSAGVATALMPDATVDMVIEAAVNVLSPVPKKEFCTVLEIAQKHSDPEEFGRAMQDRFVNRPTGDAVEILSTAYGILHMTKGDPRNAILFGVNSGRDTDCCAHTAGSLAGALKGIEAVPADWVKTVDEAMKINEHTTSNRTSFETADGLYKAAINNMERMRRVIDTISKCNTVG